MIRECTQEDQSKILEFIQNINQKGYFDTNRPFRYEDIEDISQTYGGSRDVFLLLEDEEGELVGTIALKEDSEQVGLLRRLFVCRNQRKKGYGLRLMNCIFEKARDYGYQTLNFRCTDQMIAAISLTLKKGFFEKESLDVGTCCVVVLEKKL